MGMNEQWNGKGDKSRVTNMRAYWNSDLWKKEMITSNKRCLFLDDENIFLDDENNSEPLTNISEKDEEG